LVGWLVGWLVGRSQKVVSLKQQPKAKAKG